MIQVISSKLVNYSVVTVKLYYFYPWIIHAHKANPGPEIGLPTFMGVSKLVHVQAK